MATRTDPRRTELGDHFTEGARLLWAAMEKAKMTQAAARRSCGAHGGEMSRTLYGAKAARLKVVLWANRTFGIPVEAWAKKPARPFTPPAAKAA